MHPYRHASMSGMLTRVTYFGLALAAVLGFRLPPYALLPSPHVLALSFNVCRKEGNDYQHASLSGVDH